MEFLSKVPPQVWLNHAALLIVLIWTGWMMKVHQSERSSDREAMLAVVSRNTDAIQDNTNAVRQMREALNQLVLQKAVR